MYTDTDCIYQFVRCLIKFILTVDVEGLKTYLPSLNKSFEIQMMLFYSFAGIGD